MNAHLFFWVILCFVLGSIPFGFLIAKIRGIDIRSIGSGNIGATNVARGLGKKMGVLVLLLDILKGYLPIALSLAWITHKPHGYVWLAAGMIGSVLGHMFTPWLRFHGGKGVATALGVIFAVSPWTAILGLTTYAVLYGLLRISSLGSLVGTIIAPIVLLFSKAPLPIVIATLLISCLVIIKHHENIRRLLHGNEGRL